MKKILSIALGASLLLASTVLFANQKISPKFKKNMRSAKTYYKQGNMEKAVKLIQPVLDANPNNIEVLTFMGEMHLYLASSASSDTKKAEQDKTIEYLTKSIEEDAKPENKPEKKKDIKIRKKLMKSIYANLVNISMEYFNNAIKDNNDKKYESAISNAELALKYNSKFSIPENKDYKDIRKQHNTIQENSSKILLAAAQASGDKEIFINALIKRANADQSNATFAAQVAGEYYGIEDYENASIWYGKAGNVEPKEDYFFNMGAAYSQAGNSEQTAKAFAKVIEINPENADALNNLVANSAKTKDYNNAVKYSAMLVKVQPTKENFEFATLYAMQAKDFDKTIEFCTKWAELDSDNSEPYQFLYNAYKQKGDDTNAKKYLDIFKSKM